LEYIISGRSSLGRIIDADEPFLCNIDCDCRASDSPLLSVPNTPTDGLDFARMKGTDEKQQGISID
jgi:hypothetical protein